MELSAAMQQQKLQRASLRRRRHGVRVYTAQGSNLELLRLCMSDLPSWKEVGSRRDCNLLWLDSYARLSVHPFLRADPTQLVLSDGQWCSRLEGMRELSEKLETEAAIRRCRLCGMAGFDAPDGPFPPSFLLPEELPTLSESIKRERLEHAAMLDFLRRASSSAPERLRGACRSAAWQPQPTFIIKPSSGSEGAGIALTQHEHRIPSVRKTAVAQRYLQPLLFDGKKFDLRFYCVLRAVPTQPSAASLASRDVRFEAFLHTEGLARFCTEDYEPPQPSNLRNAFAHLTNYSLNKKSRLFVRHGAPEAPPAEHTACVGSEGLGATARSEEGGEEGEEGSDEGGEERHAERPRTASRRRGALREHEEEGCDGLAAGGADEVRGRRAPFDKRVGDERSLPMASAAPQRFVGCSKRPASVVLDELAAKGLVNRASLWEKIERLAALTCIALEPDLALRFNSSRLPATTEGASTSSRPSHSSQSSRPHTAAAAPLPASPPVAPPSPRSLAEAAAPGFVGEPAVGTRQGASERPAASNVGKTEPTEPTVSSSESTAALAAHALDQHPRGTQGTQGADAAPRSGAFHVVGIDVLIDAHGVPWLLEVNSHPSLSIRCETSPAGSTTLPGGAQHSGGGGGHPRAGGSAASSASSAGVRPPTELSAVDCYVKRRVLTDILRLIGQSIEANGDDEYPPALRAQTTSPALRALVLSTDGSNRPTLIHRLRRVYEAAGWLAVTMPSRAYSADGASHVTSSFSSSVGLSCAQFLRFAEHAGLLELLTKPSLTILHQQLCLRQTKIEHARGLRWVKAEPVPRMRFDAFVRAMCDVASAAYPESGPHPSGQTADARLEALLAHMASRASSRAV